MVLSFALHERYSWVALVGVGTGWLMSFQTMNVGKFRKAANVKYPQMYAEKAEAAVNPDAMRFNCAQRAHQNTLEVLPQTLLYIFFSGITYPTTAASLGAAWIVGRVLYTIGYSSGDPRKRRMGFIHSIAFLGLQLLSTWSAIEFVRPTLPSL